MTTLETRDQIVVDHLPLVRAIAIRVYESIPVHVDLDDLIHAGVMGLIDAATRYDATMDVTFQSFAKHRIKRSILDSLRAAASSRPTEDENQSTPEYPAPVKFRPDNMVERKQLSVKLQSAISTLPDRYQKVVVLYYTKDMTMKEIGSRLNINESRVSQIHKNALEKMAVVLQSEGVASAAAYV